MSVLKKIEWLQPASILDCGAHLGYWATEARQVWPGASIICIEGNPACEAALKAGFPTIIAMLGADHGKRQYYKQPGTPHGTGNSLYREMSVFFDGCEPEEVDVVPLSSLFADGTKFDLIKMDLQGAECEVMQGGLDIVKRSKGVLLEVGIAPYNEGAPLRDFVEGFMKELGFTTQTEIEDIVHPIDRHLIQKNILFTP